jgi:prepilin-type N-terminal cleavage/methylation domain-containing protein
MKIKFKSNNNYKAFSMIEMAAVLTIISLLITFTYRNTVLVNNTKLEAVMSDVKFYSQKTSEFEKIYGALPGDISVITNLPSITNIGDPLTAGNGNGYIDTSNEAKNFWRHLAVAGLISGNYSTTASTSYNPNNPSVPGSNPLVKSYGSLTVNSTSYDAGLQFVYNALTPTDAYKMDKKYDDGMANSGIIRASGSGTTCHSSGTYTFSNTSNSCSMTFYINPKATTNLSPSAISLCNGQDYGANRISSTITCPHGFLGNVIESCTTSGWQVTRFACEPIKCTGGISAGESVQISCATNYDNYGSVTMYCSNYGILYPYSDTCNSLTDYGPCGVINATRSLPCPLGYYGKRIQTCNASNKWVNSTYTCTQITCASGSLGSLRASPTISPCLTGFTNPPTGNVEDEACSLPYGIMGSSTSTTYLMVKQYCVPDYGSCLAGSTRSSIAGTAFCPLGQVGVFSQTCNSSGYWETTINTCRPVTCGGEPIGSIRLVPNESCTVGYVGSTHEICDYKSGTNYREAQWSRTAAQCSVASCAAIATGGIENGYANWNTTDAGINAVNYASCQAGRTVVTTAPTRLCINGVWGPVANPCQ